MPNPPAQADIDALAHGWSAVSTDDARRAARAAVAALAPADLIETMLAVRLVSAHHAAMDLYRRAMQPGIGNAEAVRLHAAAVAAGGTFDAVLRTLQERRAPTEKPPRARRTAKASAEEDAATEDPLAGFTPEEIAAAEYALDNDPANLARAKLAERGGPVRWEDMTQEDRSITLAPSAPLTPCQIAVLGARLAAARRPVSTTG